MKRILTTLLFFSLNISSGKAVTIYDFALDFQKTYLGVGYNYYDGIKFITRSFFGIESEVINGKGVNVAIINTGVNFSAPYLRDNIKYQELGTFERGSNGYGYDLIDGDNFPHDYDGRGTFIAALVKSIAPAIQITPIKVMMEATSKVQAQEVFLGIRHAYKQGAKVIQLPIAIFDTFEESNRLYHLMNNEGFFKKEDVLFVISKRATLEGKRPKFNARNVISVCALDMIGRELEVSLDDKVMYDVCALGQNIYSLSIDGYGLIRESGNHVAASFVTTLASLILQVNGSLSAENVKNIIIKNVEKSPYLENTSLSGGYISFDNSLSQILK